MNERTNHGFPKKTAGYMGEPSFPTNISKDSSKVGLYRGDNTLQSLNDQMNKQNPANKFKFMTVMPRSNKNFQEDLNAKEDNFNNYYQEENERIRRLTKREKICVTDSEDELSDKEVNNPWIITPENSLKRAWDIMISLIILYSSILLPYKIAFVDDNSESAVDTIIDFILLGDIIIAFFSAYIDNEENIIKNHKKIVLTYLRTWFIIDSISILPISSFTDASADHSTTLTKINNISRIGKIPRLYRLLRLAKLMRMLKMVKRGNVNRLTKFFLEKLKVNSNIERLIYFVAIFILLNHMSACIWYFVAKLQDLDPDCWVVRLGYQDAPNYEVYIISFYWTLTTVTTVGYGDINAGTTWERIFNLLIMSCGVIMYSFAIGALSSIVSSFDAKNREMNTKLQILASIKKEFGLNDEIYDKVRKVIKYDSSKNQKDKMNFLSELPNKLRIELSQEMHDKVIQNLYFFRDQPKDFIAYVAPLLKPVKFTQGDYLYKTGDNLDEMYFVTKGTVVLCLDKNYNEKEIKEIKKNNSFGEIEMCLNKQLAYNIKVKSRVCELFVLKKDDFLRLSVNFKDFIEKFLKKSLYKFLKLIEDLNDIVNNLNNGIEEDKNVYSQLDVINEEGTDGDSSKESKSSSNSSSSSKSKSKDMDKKSLSEDDKSENEKKDSINKGNESENSKSDEMGAATDIDKKKIDKQAEEAQKKFINKCTKILECLDKVNIKFPNNDEENPRMILVKLKGDIDAKEKNRLIDKLETILSNALKSYP